MISILKKYLYLLIGASFLLSACDILDYPKEKAVITIGKRSITADDLKKDIKRIAFEMGITDIEMDHEIKPIVDKIIDDCLILEYGRNKGIIVSENELESAIKVIQIDYPEKDFKEILLQEYVDYEEWKEILRQQLLVKKIIKKASEGIAPITFSEIKTYFDSHQDEFKHPPMVKFRQIVKRNREEAEKILKRLKKGENMDEVARKHSITPEAKDGGEVGWIARGDLEESMEKAIFSLQPGKISPIIKTPYGFHIFEVVSRRPAGLKSLPEVMPEIESKLFYQKKESFYRRWLKELRGLFSVKVNQELLRTLGLG